MNEQDRGNGDGRAPSVPPSSMPPSIPPSTDEIDSDWASEPEAAAPEPPPPPPPPPPEPAAEPAAAKAVVNKVPMHKATLIGMAAVVPPAGFDVRRETPISRPPSAPPQETPPLPSQPPGDSEKELSLNDKLSSVPPPPGGERTSKPPVSQPPISQPPSVRIDSAHDVDDVKFPRRGPSVWPWLAVAAMALIFIGYWTLGRAPKLNESTLEPATLGKPTALKPPPPMPDPPYEVLPAPTTSVEAAAATASAAPSAAASGEQPAATPGATVVTLTAKPPEAHFYLRGKEVGASPLRVELAPGEKRSYEVGLRGYGTRKVMVDGSKPEILVGLKPLTPNTSPSTSP